MSTIAATTAMTVTELRDAINAALAAGLHPDTSVVVAMDGWYETITDVEHPKDGSEGVDLWFTLNRGGDADPRFTPGHADVCTGTTYDVNPHAAEDGTDVHHTGPCTLHGIAAS